MSHCATQGKNGGVQNISHVLYNTHWLASKSTSSSNQYVIKYEIGMMEKAWKSMIFDAYKQNQITLNGCKSVAELDPDVCAWVDCQF